MTLLERLKALNVGSLAAFGDSITVGLAASHPDKSWVNVLALKAGIATIHNAALSGTVLQGTSQADGAPRPGNGISRFEAKLLRPTPAGALVILYGYNDARHVGAPRTMNVANFAQTYRSILAVLLDNGFRDRLAIGSPPYPSTKGLSVGSAGFAGQTRDDFEAYVAATWQIAGEFGVFYAPVYERMRTHGDGSLASADITHPNDHGHDVIARAFAEATATHNDPCA